MNHRTYDAQRIRHRKINKGQREGPPQARLCRRDSVATAANENLQSTRSREDGFLYVVGPMGVCYKDRRCAPARWPHRGRMGTPGRKKAAAVRPRRALWWQPRSSAPPNYPARVIATDKDTGKVVCGRDQPARPAGTLHLTAAPLAVKDKVIVGAGRRRPWHARLIHRARCRDRQAPVGANTCVRAGLEPRSETGRTQQRLPRFGGGAMVDHGSYDAATNQG